MSAVELSGLLASGASLFITVIGGAMAWQKIMDRSDENKRRIEELECRCEDYDKFAAKIAAICTDLQWIKQAIDERRDKGGNNHRR